MKGTLANSVDPDQMPQNAASDHGLHYLRRKSEFLSLKENDNYTNKLNLRLSKCQLELPINRVGRSLLI